QFGNLARNAQANGSAPFLDPKWEISTVNEESSDEKARNWPKETERVIAEAIEGQNKVNNAVLPGFAPIAAGGKLIYRSYWHLNAVYLHDGKEKDGTAYKAGELAWRSTPLEGCLTNVLNEPGLKQALNHPQWFAQY